MFEWIVLISTVVFWGLAFTAIEYAVSYLDPISLASLRFAIADILFLIALVKCPRVHRRDIPYVFVLGVLGVTVYHVFLNLGEMYIQSGVASLIISTSPIYVLVLSRIFLKERITKNKVLGVVLAFSGVAIVSKPSYANIIGIILVLISAIAAATYTVMGKFMMKKYDSVTLTNYAMILGSIPLIPFLPTAISECKNVSVFLSVLFLSIFSTFLGYQGWFYILKRMEASKASVFLLAIPFVSIIAGSAVLGEEITFRVIVGLFMVIAGIYLVQKG